MNEDSLGDRMKRYEEVNRVLMVPKMPLIVRVDGRAFHTFTKGLPAFDEGFIKKMDSVAMSLCSEVSGCKMAYVQSDEISLLVSDYHSIEAQPYFGGVLQKIVSSTAANASVAMTVASQKIATFDSRAFNVPKEDVQNYFIWRQQDWTRNSVQMLARAHFSHKECDNKNNSELQDMLMLKKGVNWNDLPIHHKRGRCIVRKPQPYLIPAGPKKGETIMANEWTIDNEIPIFTQDRDYINKLVYPNEV